MAKQKGTLGSWAFLVGVILALVFGLFASSFSSTAQGYMVWALVIIGLVVGLLNVTAKESAPFLMSGVVLLIASVFGAGVMQGVQYIPSILEALLMIFVPATIIVAIKNVFSLAKN
jgi:hypothetical protein